MTHQLWCQSKIFSHSDAAKRISDTYNLHRLADFYGSMGKWFAAALHDGRTDNVLYDKKREAVLHQHHNEQLYTFICIGPAQMTPCEAEVMLKVARMAYDNGLRLTDPDDARGGRDMIKRSAASDMTNLARGRATNLIMPWEES